MEPALAPNRRLRPCLEESGINFRIVRHPGQEHLPPALLRLSVGIESVEDLWSDLDQALCSVPEV
nr:hypothetical protein [uncultured Paludibaculum sp.]